jgi:hypothetical protein
MPGDVLRRNAAGALVERYLIATPFIVAEFAFGMSVEVGSIASQRKHQQQLRVHSRGRNVCSSEPGDRGGEGLFQLHQTISP